jgi:hypothetical protein
VSSAVGGMLAQAAFRFGSLSGITLPAVHHADEAAARKPWLTTGAFVSEPLQTLGTTLGALPLSASSLVKAFDPRNNADAFAVPTPLLRWACQHATCAKIFEEDTTIAEAAALAGAPFSAKLAADVTSPELQEWLSALEDATGRKVIDSDLYLTSSLAETSASLGWHIDDIE